MLPHLNTKVISEKTKATEQPTETKPSLVEAMQSISPRPSVSNNPETQKQPKTLDEHMEHHRQLFKENPTPRTPPIPAPRAFINSAKSNDTESTQQKKILTPFESAKKKYQEALCAPNGLSKNIKLEIDQLFIKIKNILTHINKQDIQIPKQWDSFTVITQEAILYYVGLIITNINDEKSKNVLIYNMFHACNLINQYNTLKQLISKIQDLCNLSEPTEDDIDQIKKGTNELNLTTIALGCTYVLNKTTTNDLNVWQQLIKQKTNQLKLFFTKINQINDIIVNAIDEFKQSIKQQNTNQLNPFVIQIEQDDNTLFENQLSPVRKNMYVTYIKEFKALNGFQEKFSNHLSQDLPTLQDHLKTLYQLETRYQQLYKMAVDTGALDPE